MNEPLDDLIEKESTSEIIWKTYKLQIKQVEDDGTFVGYASVFGNVDSDEEVMDKGCFLRTLEQSKGIVPVLWQHDRTQPCGWNRTAEEDNYGLKVDALLLINTEFGRYAHSFVSTGLKVGGKPGLSIGFRVPKGGDYVKDGIRHFREVILVEYSIVTFAANSLAVATSAKGVCFQDLSDAEKVKVLAGIDKYYKNLGKISPFKSDGGFMRTNFKAEDFNSSLTEAVALSDLNDLRWAMEDALYDAIADIQKDESLTLDDKKAAIATSLQQYAAAMASWWARYLDITQDDEDVDDGKTMKEFAERLKSGQEITLSAKEGRSISATTKSALAKAKASILESQGHSKMSAKCKAAAIKIISDLSDGAYQNDVNKPNPVGGGKSEKEKEKDRAVEPPPAVDPPVDLGPLLSNIEKATATLEA